MSHSTVRLGNGELGAVTELHHVNLSSENRFEASPLGGNSTATGTFRRHLGGLMIHGANLGVLFERAAGYVDRILKGAKPSELPVQPATEFELSST